MIWPFPETRAQPASSARQRGELRDAELRHDSAARARRERIDARLDQLDADLDSARAAIGQQIAALSFERRLNNPGTVRAHVLAALEKMTLYMRKCALADPNYDPGDASRYDGLHGVDADFLILCGELCLLAALNGAGEQRQQSADLGARRPEVEAPVNRAAVARAIVRAGAKRRAERVPSDDEIVIDMQAHLRNRDE